MYAKNYKGRNKSSSMGVGVVLLGVVLSLPLFARIRPAPSHALVLIDPYIASFNGAVTPTGYSVEEDIKQVFGGYYPKAMLLLKGDGSKNACAENRGLNPKALNDNTTWGGVGKDYGVFQINDRWQGITNTRFLYDPKINIRLAWRIFEDNGYSFKLWTCGKHYKI